MKLPDAPGMWWERNNDKPTLIFQNDDGELVCGNGSYPREGDWLQATKPEFHDPPREKCIERLVRFKKNGQVRYGSTLGGILYMWHGNSALSQGAFSNSIDSLEYLTPEYIDEFPRRASHETN